jgi:hypothetical protein
MVIGPISRDTEQMTSPVQLVRTWVVDIMLRRWLTVWSLNCFLWMLFNKKFWDELIVYFPLIRHGLYRKRRVQLLEAVITLRAAPKLFKQDNFRLPGIEGSQSRQRVKNGHESRGTRNQESLCWRGQQQFSSQWPVVVTPLPSSKRRLYFKTRKSLEKTKIWSWVWRGPKPKTTLLARASSNLLDWTFRNWKGDTQTDWHTHTTRWSHKPPFK